MFIKTTRQIIDFLFYLFRKDKRIYFNDQGNLLLIKIIFGSREESEVAGFFVFSHIPTDDGLL